MSDISSFNALETLPLLLWIAAAGAAGALSRYAVDKIIHILVPTSLPVGIWLVNMSGALFVGVLFGVLSGHIVQLDPASVKDLSGGVDSMGNNSININSINSDRLGLWLILSTGFAGSYTTFSGWMVQTVELIQSGYVKFALINIIASIIPGLYLTLTGIWLGSLF
jgi:fluoride exporter